VWSGSGDGPFMPCRYKMASGRWWWHQFAIGSKRKTAAVAKQISSSQLVVYLTSAAMKRVSFPSTAAGHKYSLLFCRHVNPAKWKLGP